MNVSSRFDPAMLRASRAAPAASITPKSSVDPQLLAALVPVVAGCTLLITALAAKAIFVLLGFGPRAAIPAIFGVSGLAGLIGYGVFRQIKIFDPKNNDSKIPLTLRTSSATGASFLILALLLALLEVAHHYPASFLTMWVVSSFVLTIAEVSIINRYRMRLIAQGRLAERVALFGSGKLLTGITRELMASNRNILVVGVFADADEKSNAGPGSSGGLEDLVRCAKDGLCDRIIVALPLQDERLADAMAQLEPVPINVQLCCDPLSVPFKVRGAESHGPIQLVDLQCHPLGAHGMVVKAIMDYSLAALALLLLAPVMALIAVVIKLESKGPVFFIQARGGYRHRVVNVIKFRSMTVMENGDEVKQAERGDQRITKFGAFLRRTSLDELPQLINVLRGELSLVGPRPHALAHDRHYSEIVEQYANRHKMKPGITGWAQVNGFRSATRDPELMRQRVKFDLFYIDNWSPWLDIAILFRTIGVVFWDRTAY